MATSARISVKSCELCRKLFSVSFRGRNFSVPSFKQNSGQSYSYAFHTKAQKKFQFQTVSSQHGSRLFNTISKVEEENEADDLYRQIDVEVKGHDPMVLKSYEQFVSLAARELEINLAEVSTPPKVITRRTLLKSVHIFKKHRVQYEWRTHFKVFQFKYLTGSTADTFLEYIQRNLPEGVAMKVTRHQLERLPEHITAAINNQPEDKLASS